MAETVRVNFARSIPLFPLAGVVLLPHETLPLHVFEPRYRQMVRGCLDTAGQFAIATIDPVRDEKSGGLEPRPLLPAACVGQIVGHEARPDGRYNLLLQGVCRGRIVQIHEPEPGRAYRTAAMRPLEQPGEEPPLSEVRRRLGDLLAEDQLESLEAIERLREWAEHPDIHTRALVDLIGLILVRDPGRKYRLLAESDVRVRAEMVGGELEHLQRLLAAAAGQAWRSWPRGMSWN